MNGIKKKPLVSHEMTRLHIYVVENSGYLCPEIFHLLLSLIFSHALLTSLPYYFKFSKAAKLSVTMAGSKATVRVDNQYTSTFPITNGVRQGDALSSILFDLVLEAILQKMNTTGHIGTKNTQILAYTDDVTIMCSSKNALKDTLFHIEVEARRRGLLVNETKTKYLQVAKAVPNNHQLCCG